MVGVIFRNTVKQNQNSWGKWELSNIIEKLKNNKKLNWFEKNHPEINSKEKIIENATKMIKNEAVLDFSCLND